MKIYMTASTILGAEKKGGKRKAFEANTVEDVSDAIGKKLIADGVAVTYAEYQKMAKKQGITTKDVNPSAKKKEAEKEDK